MIARVLMTAVELDLVIAAAKASAKSRNLITDNWLIIVALVVIAVFGFGLYRWDQGRKAASRDARTPQSLFQELCAAHKLTRGEQTLLSNLCTAQGLTLPAVLFVDSSILLQAEAVSVDDPDGLRKLREKLFPSASTP